MKQIKFTDEMHIGIETLDTQHKQLIHLINQLATELGEGSASKQLSCHVSDMMNYTLNHLVDEERLLQMHGYPNFENHRAEHKAFREKTIELYVISKTDIEKTATLMHHYLCDWIVDHILNSDMAYKSYLKECKVS